ncbi:serine carboxypeptidase II-3-like [Coffea eugenioides]|uniref:serine carboxypeptidase II-3-like n=1 Tax=Coffea eugenioides TaxID=49369 RepID=UPI000F60AA97|nr:serine carboxypeptidase II-3-like [Coffea eugenioides]
MKGEHGYDGYDRLVKFLQASSLRKSVNHVNEELNNEYSPVYIGPQDGLKAADKITALPGEPKGVNFDQYSGYVTVDPKAGRSLFYYFAESQNSSTKPLVLWLNGGPGASSFGIGAMTELGPFQVSKGGKTLWENPCAWNNGKNSYFSPAGVGFSYSNTSSDYITGDTKTAADSYTILVNWLERFPEYKTRDFFITGESYAGRYVPQLAQLILHNNKITNQTVINLKGIAESSITDIETQNWATYDYYRTHALISDEIHQGIVSSCNFSSADACQTYKSQAHSAKGHVDDNDIYAPLCSSSSNTPPSINDYDPCSDNYVYTYLNTPAVQKSLHANTTRIPGPWKNYNGYIGHNWDDETDTVLPVIKELTSSGVSVWLYSGDIDSVCFVTTTRYALNKLRLSVKTPWYAWYTQGEVDGYAVEYENLTFVIVRGAGHLVPSYQPARALTLFSSFLVGKLPPSN